jgi:DNA-directed RNA polymerase specialized sigma24 family protein
MEALRRCLERLTQPQAAVVQSRLAGDDYPEVCRRLRLEPSQAHKLYHTAKELLNTCVERALR